MNKEKSWYIYAKKADFFELGKKYNIAPVVARVIVNRNIAIEKISNYLNPSESDLYSEEKLKDVKKAAEFTLLHIKENKKIRIVGDYDIDGVCSTYILVKALQNLGANISYEIPDRIKDGYGINELIIDEAYKDGIELIITCDNGIAAFEAIKRARELGINVIVTDHHDIRKAEEKEVLPEANFIINPKQESCTYPFESICGANVAYKFIKVLYDMIKADKSILDELFDFVAIASIGDVMPLQNENRYIVKKGLKSIENTKNLGLRLLIEECNLENKKLGTFDIGFIIGPCLNAGGRLKSAKIALDLFLENNKDIAMKKAKELVELNDDRKNLTVQNTKKAIELVEKEYKNDKVLVIYLEDCHESLAGIIAGRIKERFYKPSIVLTDAHDSLLKGSARSIEAYNIFEKLLEADKFLTKFGGHPMAAGLSLEKDKLAEFRKFLNEHANLKDEDLKEKVWIDSLLPFSKINESLIADLERLEPFGNANEKPAFALKDVKVLEKRILGENKNLVKFILEDEDGIKMTALLFTDGIEFMEKFGDKKSMSIIYYPSINEYMNKKSLQIVIKEWKT